MFVPKEDTEDGRRFLKLKAKGKGVSAEDIGEWLGVSGRTIAAIALAEGNHEQSREFLAKAIAALDRKPGVSGSVAAARTRLVALMGV